MFKYVLKRLGFAFITFVILFFLAFVLIKAMPPIKPRSTDLAGWEIFRRMGYDKPIMEQLKIYLRNLFGSDGWGYSMQIRPYTPVWEMIGKRIVPSMTIGLFSILIGIPLGLALGYYAARRKNKWQDHVISTGVMVFVSVPSFIFGFLVLYLLCFKLDWWDVKLPTTDEVGGSWLSPAMIWAMFPAILTLASREIAGWARGVRAELTEAMTSDYILLARTKGLTHGQAIRRHAFKNAMVPLFPGILAAFVGIMSGAMITEKLFGIPGIGDLFLISIDVRDYEIFMVTSMFFLAINLITGIVLDISRGFLDPRVRVGTKKGGSY